MSRIEQSVVTITPAGAKKMLAACIPGRNRRLNKSYITLFARQMSEGNWSLNGEPIIIGEDGHVLDGQHRLHAIIEANASIRVLLVRNVAPEAFDTIDQGKSRSASDVIGMCGVRNSTAAAAAARCLWSMPKTGQPVAGVGGVNRPTPTAREVCEVWAAHPDLGKSLAMKKNFDKLGFYTTMIVMHYLTMKIDQNKAERFWTGVITGENLQAGNPAHALRERLSSARGAGDSWRLDRIAAAALVVKAWNAHYRGGKISVLKYGAREEFPEIAGLTQDILAGNAGQKKQEDKEMRCTTKPPNR